MAIQLSLSQFYREVTGSRTGNRKTIAPAIKRWGVEWDETKPPKSRCIGIDQLPVGKRGYKADREARREERAASAAVMRETLAAKRAAGTLKSKAPKDPMVEVLGRLKAIEELLQTLGVTIEHINSRTYKGAK